MDENWQRWDILLGYVWPAWSLCSWVSRPTGCEVLLDVVVRMWVRYGMIRWVKKNLPYECTVYATVLMTYVHLLAENKSLPPTFTYVLGGQQMAS